MVVPDPEKGGIFSEHHNSSSASSDSSSSSSSTDPSSITSEDNDGLPRIQHAPHSATPPRRGNRRPTQRTPSRRLGAIDEHSPSIAPDIPTRNPNRPKKMVSFLPADATKFFSFSSYSRPEADIPPPNAYDKIVGPRGEKFNDVRQNRPYNPPGRGRGWRRIVCLGLVIFAIVLAIALGVGLGVGLTRKKGASTPGDSVPVTGSSSGVNNDVFPIGTFAIQTYLVSTATDCTSNPSTWRCYPYNTYSQSATNSFSTLQWRITTPTNSTLNLEISNTNPTFSYPFTNVPLTISNANDVRLSAFTFDFTYRKQVVPNADITGDNTATRCYYNSTVVSVRLYNNAQGAGGVLQGPPAGQTTPTAGTGWPYAIEYRESSTGGPECFRYTNGQEGARVDVPSGTGSCACSYRNFGLS